MTRHRFALLLCALLFPWAARSQVGPSPQPTEKEVARTERVLQEDPHSPSTIGQSLVDRANLRITPSAVGTVGLLNVGSADLGPTGLLRFSVVGAHFSSGHFPSLGAQDDRTSGAFSAAFTPLPWLEAYFSYAVSSNYNSTSSPALIQALGDLSFGAKLAKAFAPGLFAGVDLRLQTFSAVGTPSVAHAAFGFAPRLVGTYDVREHAPKVPLRLHANAGFALDGTGYLFTQYALNAAETYALGVNQYTRFLAAAGAEAPLPYATPFVEYNLGIPLGTPGGGLETPEGRKIPVGKAMPQVLSLGAKVTAVQDLTLLAAINVGLTPNVGQGIPATEPFSFTLGAAFNVDPFSRRETKVVISVRERQMNMAEGPKLQQVKGVVVDAKARTPLSGVIISVAGSEQPPVATDHAAGRFLTYGLPAGKAKLTATKEGFRPAEQEVLVEEGKIPEVQLALEPVAHPARFLVQVSAKKKPLAAKVSFQGTAEQELLMDGKTQPSALEMPAGKYTVTVAADGHLAQMREVQASGGSEMTLSFDLQPEPKKKLVVVKENKIQILQPVHFATAKATILPDSYNLLDQVVDAIIKSNIKRVRVDGHTDNRGPKKSNQLLSEERARAVGDYLVKAGIESPRVETSGHGDSRPVAPNLTARGRELNRRVEFVILDR